jgi:3-phenylpropionate/trans-cinnamate dioxygenase ferredoxin component
MSAVRACSLSELDPDGGVRRVDVDGTPVAVVRIGDRVYAVNDTCSHADVSLSGGEVDLDECALECPKHGSLFSLETGEPLSLPALKPVATYAVAVDGDDVSIDVHAEPTIEAAS